MLPLTNTSTNKTNSSPWLLIVTPHLKIDQPSNEEATNSIGMYAKKIDYLKWTFLPLFIELT